MVRIELGHLRLVSEPSGRYAIHEMQTRQTGKRAGTLYIRGRHSGLTLSQALAKLVELWPHREDTQIESLAELHSEVTRAREQIRQALSESRPERCPRCQSFKKWHADCRRCRHLATLPERKKRDHRR